MTLQRTNLFTSDSSGEFGERILPLLKHSTFRLEHIVSQGHASEEGFWYDEPNAEWVLLVRGQATLNFDGEGMQKLIAGDYLLIPAHARHRVERVSEDALWLALHFSEAGPLRNGNDPITGKQSK